MFQVRIRSLFRPMGVLLVFLLFAGPVSNAWAAGSVAPNAIPCLTGQIRIMPVGDSITQGSSSGFDTLGEQISYRYDLYNDLTTAGYDVNFVGSQTGGSNYAGFDPDEEGHPGWTDYQVAGSIYNWLVANPADIILLHIGTNGLNASAADEVDILDEIDRYETDYKDGNQIIVLVARIINRVPTTSVTTDFNNAVQAMVEARPDYGSSLFMVNMETGAGLDYRLYNDTPPGDIYDQTDKDVDLHPWTTGYSKMAALWYSTLDNLLKQACNTAPTLSQPADQNNAEGDSGISLQLHATDPDGGQTITYGASNLPEGLSLDTGTGLISGTIGYDAAAGSPYQVTVTADDGAGGTASKKFQWTVTNTNRAPQVTFPGDQTYAEGDPVSIAPTSYSDPDSDTITFSASGMPADLSIDTSNGVISGTLGYEDAAGSPYTVQVTATDDGLPSSLQGTATFQLTVTNTNQAPVVDEPAAQNDAEGKKISLQVSGTDPDGDPLTYNATNLPEDLSIDPSTGLISGTLSYNAHLDSPYDVTVTAIDGEGLSDSQTFLWSVTDVNAPPKVANPRKQTDMAGDAISLQMQASDPDQGDKLIFSASGLPAGLKISGTTGLISGTLKESAVGLHSVTVTVTDGEGSSDSVTFAWKVRPLNHAPVALSPGDQADPEGQPISLKIKASDEENDSFTYSATGLPGSLTINKTTGKIQGVLGFETAAESPYHVTIEVKDAGGRASSISFNWIVYDRVPVFLPLTIK